MIFSKPYVYERFGPDNKLVVSFISPVLTADLNKELGLNKSKTKPQKGHLIYKNGRYGGILWIDRDDEEVVFKYIDDGSVDSLHLDLFSNHKTRANKKGVTVTWILD